MAKRQGSTEVKPETMSAETKALNNAISQIEKTFGAGAIMKLGEGSHLEVEGISTGALSLDIALGGVGVPRGRILEIFGPESSGKTTLTLHIIASAQKLFGGVAAFIDAGRRTRSLMGQAAGGEAGRPAGQPARHRRTGPGDLRVAGASNAVDVIVIDSVAALIPKAEIEGEMGDSHVGLQARLMSQAMRKLTGAINKSKTTVVSSSTKSAKRSAWSTATPKPPPAGGH